MLYLALKRISYLFGLLLPPTVQPMGVELPGVAELQAIVRDSEPPKTGLWLNSQIYIGPAIYLG